MKRKFVISFLISTIFFIFVFSKIDMDIFSKKDSVPSIGQEDNEDNGEMEEAEQKIKNEILFLLMGIDGSDVNKAKGKRTDTMMLVKVDFKSGQIDLLSLPRDTRVLIKGKQDKLNHAHANGGTKLTMRTVKELLNIDVGYYVKVDYEVVKDVVEAIGGVWIDVPRDMEYYDNTKGYPLLDINLKKGEQLLNGKEAHDFLRWRNNNDMTKGYVDGDVGRIKAQQYFMKELAKQTLTIKNIFKLPKLVETYYNNVDTNIPMSLMLQGVNSARKLDAENMRTETLPGVGETINGVSYYLYNEDQMRDLIKDMFGDYLMN